MKTYFVAFDVFEKNGGGNLKFKLKDSALVEAEHGSKAAFNGVLAQITKDYEPFLVIITAFNRL